MNCRHDLALGTCRRCYPSTGTIDPGPEEDYEPNLEGPGAIPRETEATKPAPSRLTPNGVTLSIFPKPDGRAPILQLFKQGEGSMRAVLRADDRAWLRRQLAAFDPPPSPTATQLAVLTKLAAIADAYEASNLDEHRPEWGEKDLEEVELLAGRGGRTLLTLADAFAAREALLAAKMLCMAEEIEAR